MSSKRRPFKFYYECPKCGTLMTLGVHISNPEEEKKDER